MNPRKRMNFPIELSRPYKHKIHGMIEYDQRSILSGQLFLHSRIKQHQILRMQGSAVLWTFFILLIVVVAVVILLLPGYVDAVYESKKSEKTSPQIFQPNPETPNALLKQLVNKKAVESSQQKFISLKNQLESLRVALWGGESYLQALKLARQGDQLFQQEQMITAGEVYKSAVAALEELAASREQRLQTAILFGYQALEMEDVETARQQFIQALSIEPENKRAKKGMNRVLILEQVTVKLGVGSKHEKQGQLADALADYQEALVIDPNNVRAGKLLTRIEQKITREKFHNAMTDGYHALEKNNFSKARLSFKQAKAIKPNSAEVRDALELVDGETNLVRIRQYKTKAEGFERKEQWQNAVNTYQLILDIDNTLEFALEGKKRSQFYVRVNNDMDYIIQHPDRLASDEPYNSAVELLKKVQGIPLKGGHLKTTISLLDELVKVARLSVPITLESDGKTDIVVYKFGKLGRFSIRTLSLNPGQYTAVGSCPGYQDVRKEFTVLANQPKAYFIRCEVVI